MVNLDYLYNPDAAKKVFTKNYFSEKKLGFNVIEHGTILPHKRIFSEEPLRRVWGAGGIVDNNGGFVKNSHVLNGMDGAYTPPSESIVHKSQTAVYLGMFFHVWGHAITENIRRVWFLKDVAFKNEFKNCPIVYIPWSGYPIERQQNFKRLLEILEIDIDKLQPITQPTRFDKIILPEGSFCSIFTNEYRETIDCVRNFAIKNRTPTASKKIYYFYGRSQVGEERLAQYFKGKGYEIIRPELLTLDEQLNLMINAESFASTAGSCAHNSLFLRDGTETIFIPRSANAFTNYQPLIDQICSLNANYVDSTMSIFNINHDSFCFIISEQLKRFFNDEFDGYEEDNFRSFLEYVKSPVRRNRSISPKEKIGYGITFTTFMEQIKRHEDLIASYGMPPHWEQLRPLLTYQTHIHTKGWGDWSSEDKISNPLDQKLDIQAIKIDFSEHKVYYSVYYNAQEGWSAVVANGEMAGTTGKTKPIYGMKVWLDEAGTKDFDILYRMHKFDGEWTPWAKNGEIIYSHGQKLNSIQIKLEPKN